MAKTTELTVTEGKDEFYPTPDTLIEKMLDGLDYRMIESVLEPSAGKGDLIQGFLWAMSNELRYSHDVSVDAIEIDPYLRQILSYNFSDAVKEDTYKAYRELDRMLSSSRTEEQRAEYSRLRSELDYMDYFESVHIVHDDFLTYRSYKHYDLILMNPPFSVGDKHLLKAMELQERGGAIVCLLNAETLRNPYTATRQQLAKKLQQYEAQIEFVDDAFQDAERKARVDVAIVRVHIPEAKDESDIWERMKKAEVERSMPDPELKALVSGDYIEQAVQLYNTEVSATLELVRQYKALAPYMTSSLTGEYSWDKSPIVALKVGDKEFSLNRYLRSVRLKYWRALFHNDKFTGKLTSELLKRFQETVDKMADYEFSAFNIKQVALEMNAAMSKGIENEILRLFDQLTVEHSYYPECCNNRHYYNGWTTNKAHKIGKKVILPTNLQSYSWKKEAFDEYRAAEYLSDIEKVLNYLEAEPQNDNGSLERRVRMAHDDGQNRNICLRYFAVDIFKKGTIHIKFHPSAMPIVDRLNIYASRKKGWLPPSYGKADYSNLDVKEKEVVDSFHGDGTEGSGEKDYRAVMADSQFYLAEPVNHRLMLGA